MNILHVIESLGIGGAERLLVMVLPELRRQGDEVAVAVLQGPFDLQPALEAAGIPVLPLPARAQWNLLGRAVDIARCARDRKAGIVHAHLYFPAVATALAGALHLLRAPAVVTFHNLAYAPGVNKKGPGLQLRRWLAARLYPRGLDAMLAVSEAVASHYREALQLPRVDIMHNPVDVEALDRVPPHAGEAAHAALHLVVPGRLVPEKGHADLLPALAILREAHPTLRVTFAGEGPRRASLEDEIRRLELAGMVTVTGVLAHVEMMRLVANADVVAVPSRAEGFGLTALEAMTLRRPVVACRVGGLPEVVQHGVTGLLVEVEAPRELAAALDRLLSDAGLRARMGAAGRRRAEDLFALPAVAARLRAVYAALAAQSSGASAATPRRYER